MIREAGDAPSAGHPASLSLALSLRRRHHGALCPVTTLGSPADTPVGGDSHEGPRNASAGLNGAGPGPTLIQSRPDTWGPKGKAGETEQSGRR